MIYITADIHGYYESYQDFLNYVGFSTNDKLYIIGDLINRGSDGIAIVQDVMKRPNVISLMGNHEHMILPTLEKLSYSKETDQHEIIRNDVSMGNVGQLQTLVDFCNLNRDQQYEVIDYLQNMPLYKEIEVNDQKYLLVHAGLFEFSVDLLMDFYSAEELLYDTHHYHHKYFDDKIIIVGHKPTRFITGAEPDRIYRSHNNIAIDCGCGFGGNLGVLCLDTGEEFYFREH